MNLTVFYGIPWKHEFNDLLEDYHEYPEEYGFTPLVPIQRDKTFKVKSSNEEFIGFCGEILEIIPLQIYTYEKYPTFQLKKELIKKVQDKINSLPDKIKIQIDSEINTIGIYYWLEQ